MNTFNRVIFALLAVCSFAFGQSALNTTTLSANITTTASNRITVASTSNITGPGIDQAQGGLGSPTGGPNHYGLFVDNELMQVNSVPSSGVVAVQRGVQGTRTALHNSGATVYIGYLSQFINYDRSGRCTSTDFAILPQLNTNNGKFFNCPSVGPNANNWVVSAVTAPPASYTIADNTVAGNSTLKVCHARYSFATDGGAVSTITPAVGCTIPIYALIYRVIVTPIATTVGSTGNVSVGLSAGGAGAAALLGATARASLVAGTPFDGVPIEGTASASNATYIKMTAAGNITVTIATNALTAGILDIDVFYFDMQA